MKTTTQFTKDAWLSGDYTGDQRPMVRATIGKMFAQRPPYTLWWDESKTWRHNGHYMNTLFNQDGGVRELNNIKSIKYSRGVDTDVATCTIVLYNVQWFADVANERPEEFDFPGWFTPNRGENDHWDYGSNNWKDWLLPDRMIRTFEGYGADLTKVPEDDPRMYPSGVWLIDTVVLGTDGTITLECRDLGRLLLDQILYPPIVPFDVYPLQWEAFKSVPNETDYVPAGGWLSPTYEKDSNEKVLAANLKDGGQAAVNDNGKVRGHQGSHAQDEDPSTYWLSAGSSDPNQMEWIQFDVANVDVRAIRILPKGGPYMVYVSLYHATKGWRGGGTIPYEVAEDGTDLQGDIKYVKWARINNVGDARVVMLDRTFTNITKIRLTFSTRWDSNIGQERHFRTAVQEVKYAPAVDAVAGTGTDRIGNYGDYTTIVKWLTSWAGFFWPDNAKVKRADGTKKDYAFAAPDPAMAMGRAWGDFMLTNTTGIVKLDVDMFDKKPVMDGIAAIREIVGFDFWIDETGGVIWRLPNLWKKGNYKMPTLHGSRARTSEIVTIDEKQTLMGMEVTLTSKNVRENVFVADVNGNFGVAVRGFNPAPAGLKRVGGWTDQHFKNRAETRRVADLIAVRQAFSYRTNQVTIAANPALQIDDQVVIKERMTGEGYLHRITNIASDFDFETGKWTYQLTTEWMGPEAFTENAWKPKLATLTQMYLNELD